tara:strand:- start:10214 stop:12676 length:2463 start_codon:yes stop_codon:yes gene_type:complete
MLSDKVMKKKYKPIFFKSPNKFYATSVLKKEGFNRKDCPSCKKPFWSVIERKVCGDPQCSGEGFTFIGNSPAKHKLDYIGVWKKFSKMFKTKGYTPIKRYPSVARWNPTMEYTNSSISAFQPYVISGEVTPPSESLVLPQFCLRFGDTDNVGITMSHNTGFVMIGQHQFIPKSKWNQNKVFQDMLDWNTKGLGVSKEDMTFHEDAWAGGGNLGPCIEFFSRDCEVWNQVYMLYEQTPKGVQDLKLKVLDMGMGMERAAWFSQGSPTIYDAVFPTVLKKLKSKTGLKVNKKLLQRYVPHGGQLNNDEVEDMNKAWKKVAKLVEVDVKELRQMILPLSRLYSIGEHMRSALIVLNDGGLPSNVGGGYNLRMLIRRSLGFIDKEDWDIDLTDLCSWHADYLEPMYPELKKNLDNIHKILEIEKKKYNNTKEKTSRIVANLKNINEEKLLELYDSQGISPDMIPGLKVPDDFYARVAEMHEQKEQVAATKKKEEIKLGNLEATKALYFEDYKKTAFTAKVLKVKGDIIVLDKTTFYPTSGGQLHDKGTIDGAEVNNVFKQGNLILHHVYNAKCKEGDTVKCIIDKDRRIQMAQHHTSTHIINAAAKKVLGSHANQAGAFKDLDKARIDITHYQSLSDKEVTEIEKEANKIIKKKIKIEKKFYPRSEAEKKFGMEIYQGGAVPGKMLRIVNIKGIDVEACGGTHLDNTSEAEKIKIIKTTKVQDGVIRIVFVAGAAAKAESEHKEDMLQELASLLNCDIDQIPGRAQELFTLWKKVVKKKKDVEKKLVSTGSFKGDVTAETAKILKTQPEHIIKTVKRFLKELDL